MQTNETDLNIKYISETQKIRPIIQKYLNGFIIDIGCGQDKVTPDAFGIDARKFPHTNYVTFDLYNLHKQLRRFVGKVDVVYSSHVLEHIPDDIRAIREWSVLLKKGGYLILYLPDDRWYDNEANPEHLRSFTYPQFKRFIQRSFPYLEVVESGEHHGYDKYSFYIVAKKVGKVTLKNSIKNAVKNRLKAFLINNLK